MNYQDENKLIFDGTEHGDDILIKIVVNGKRFDCYATGTIGATTVVLPCIFNLLEDDVLLKVCVWPMGDNYFPFFLNDACSPINTYIKVDRKGHNGVLRDDFYEHLDKNLYDIFWRVRNGQYDKAWEELAILYDNDGLEGF